MRVLIATDGSEIAIDAARRAQDVLAPMEQISLLCVYSDVPGDDAGGFEGSVETPEEMERDWDQLQADAHAALARTAAVLAAKGSVERRVELGDAGATICAVAEREEAEVIVVGPHDEHRARRVTQDVLNDDPRPKSGSHGSPRARSPLTSVVVRFAARTEGTADGWRRQDFFAAALPPLRPAALCWAVVPPCDAFPPEPDFFPPRLDAPGELAILAARCLDIPLSFRASYCFGFFTLADFDGIDFSFVLVGPGAYRWPRARQFVAAHLRAPRQVAALRLGIQLLAGLG